MTPGPGIHPIRLYLGFRSILRRPVDRLAAAAVEAGLDSLAFLPPVLQEFRKRKMIRSRLLWLALTIRIASSFIN